MTKPHFLVLCLVTTAAGYNSNASLVAYRVNADSNSASYNKLERMGKGLALERSLYDSLDSTSVS